MTAAGARHYGGNALPRMSQTVAPISAEESSTKLCPVCRSPIPQAAPTGRPRVYCSDRCRQAAAEHRRVVAQVASADLAMRELVDALRTRRSVRQPSDAAERTCRHCGRILPLSAFRLIRGRWPSSWCRSCSVERTREWRAANRDRLNAARRDTRPRYCAACGATLAKLPGPGRWPRFCPTCRATGRAAAQAEYRNAHREARAATERERRRTRTA